MARAKDVLAAGLSLLLACGGAPGQAAEFVRAAAIPRAAPAPVLPLPAALSAAPLSVSFAAGSPLPVPILSLSAAALPAAAAPAAEAPAAAAALGAAPASPARENGVSAQRVAQSSLRKIGAPETAPDAGRVFDGALGAPAAGEAAPVRADAAGPAAPARLGPPRPKRPRSTPGRVLRAAAVGVGASALAPFLWHAAPAAGALLLWTVAIAPVAAGAALLLAVRVARAVHRRLSRSPRAPAAAPPSRRKIRAVRALGFALGVALTAATALEQRPLVEAYHAYADSRLPESKRTITTRISGTFFAEETARTLGQSAEGRAALDGVRGADGAPRMPVFFVTEPRQRVVALPGSFFADSAVRLLSQNPVGRQVLDGLRDRGGVVRMPAFYVSSQEGSVARYAPPDAVYLSVETIEASGVTVAEFLRNPQAQLRYLESEQATIVHELEHADQARRSPFNADTWVLLRTDGGRLLAAIKAYALGPKDAVSLERPGEDFGRSARAPDAAPLPDAAPRPDATEKAAAFPVYLDGAEIARSGLTVARFVSDHEAQKEYILRHQAELARALRPIPAPAPAAARETNPPALTMTARSAAKRSFSVDFGMVQEWEYEAYFTEHFYTHERLKADPAADIPGGEYSAYVRALDDYDDFVGSIDRSSIYEGNFHGRSAYYARYLADMRGRWDAHRVEAHVLLARRAQARNEPAAAREHLELARRIAAEHGLPAPALGD